MGRRRAPQLGLTPALVAEAFRRARARLLAFQAKGANTDALWMELREELALSPDSLAPEALLRRFFGAAVALTTHGTHPALSRGESRDLSEVMEAVLRLAGGERGDVAVAYLQVTHHEVLGAMAACDGRHADAAWRQLAAYQAGQAIAADLDPAFFATLAARMLRTGATGACTQALAVVESAHSAVVQAPAGTASVPAKVLPPAQPGAHIAPADTASAPAKVLPPAQSGAHIAPADTASAPAKVLPPAQSGAHIAPADTASAPAKVLPPAQSGAHIAPADTASAPAKVLPPAQSGAHIAPVDTASVPAKVLPPAQSGAHIAPADTASAPANVPLPAQASTLAMAALTRAELAALEGTKALGEAALARAANALGEARLAYATAAMQAAGGELAPMAGVVRKHGQALPPAELLESILWLRAPKQRELMARAPSLAAVTRRHRPEINASPSLKALQEIAAAVVEMYDTERPLAARGEALLAALAGRSRLPSVTQELLALAAAGRALARYTQHALLPAVMEPYRALSLGVSDGASGDVLGLAADLLEHRLLTVRAAADEDGPEGAEGDVPTHGARAVALTSMAGKIGIKLVGAKLRLALAGKERAQAVKLRNAQRIAATVAVEMRGLRGVVQKLGQTLSFATALMPDEARAVLGALCSDAQPLGNKETNAAVEKGLGKPPAELYAEWTAVPLAAGSIGQVHAATLHDGRRVAVKVQYPGVAAAIRGDFKNAGLIAGLLKRALPTANVDEVLAAAEETLIQECDYVQEAAHQRLAAALLADVPGIVIPGVHPDRSSGTVLTSDYMSGESFDSFCAVASAAERDRIGALMFIFVMRSALRDGLFYGDPQPGNFLILPGERVRLGVVDFGCVGRWDADTRAVFADVYRIFVGEEGDFPELVRRAGFVGNPATFDFAAEHERLATGLMLPFLKGGTFTFTEEFTVDLARQAMQGNKNLKSGKLPPAMILTPRLIWGLYFLLGRLRATADWRAMLLAILAQTPRLGSGTADKAS